MGTLGHCHVLELGQPRCDELAARGGEAHGARLHASRTLRVELRRVLEESANGSPSLGVPASESQPGSQFLGPY